MPNRRWSVLVNAAGLLLACAILTWHSLQYNFVTDDAYISFVFSRNFAEHGEFVFNLGDYVEGYTNFLWTFVLGVLMLVGVDPELSSRVLALVCALVTLAATWRLMKQLLGEDTLLASLPALLLASSSGFACWTSGGLETQLFAMLVSLAVVNYVASFDGTRSERTKRWWIIGLLLALAAMTRPEGAMITAIIGGHRLIWLAVSGRKQLIATFSPRSIGAELVGLATFALIWGLWFSWRWWYYGYPFPNTYYVKAHGPWVTPNAAAQMWSNGVYYIWVWVKQTKLLFALPFIVIAVEAAVRSKSQHAAVVRRTVSLLAPMALIYLYYTASVGGDFMGLHRFIMPVFVIAAILIVVGIARCAELLSLSGKIAAAVATAVWVAFFVSQIMLTQKSLQWGNFANDSGIDTPRFLITYTEDRALIGKKMAECFAPTDFSIVGGAGAQPYFGRMEAIDVFGLVSDRVAHREPRSNPRAGHTKWGSDSLLASYYPTFVFSCYSISAKPPKERLGCGGYWFANGFEQLTIHVPGMRERGEYYTFLAKKARNFQCPGIVR